VTLTYEPIPGSARAVRLSSRLERAAPKSRSRRAYRSSTDGDKGAVGLMVASARRVFTYGEGAKAGTSGREICRGSSAVEQRTCNATVVGSNPSLGTKSTKPRLWPLSLVIDEPLTAVKSRTSEKKARWQPGNASPGTGL
jgi:hypothetical protein